MKIHLAKAFSSYCSNNFTNSNSAIYFYNKLMNRYYQYSY